MSHFFNNNKIMEISDKYACQIHGIISSDSDSDFENTKDFDEEYNSLKPPPIEYESIKDKIIVISRCEETNNEKETFESISEMTLVINKKKKKSKQENINRNKVKPNQNKGNIVAVDNRSSKLSKNAVSVSQEKKKSKTTLQSKSNNSSSIKCVSIQNLKASKDHSQVQTKKASNSSKKKKLKNTILENKLKNSKQVKNQNNSSNKSGNISNLTKKHVGANIGANIIVKAAKKKNKNLKNSPQFQVHVAINKDESPSVNISSDTPKSTQENGSNCPEICEAQHKVEDEREMGNDLFVMGEKILELGSASDSLHKGTQLMEKFHPNQIHETKFTVNCETEKELPLTQKLIEEKQSVLQNYSGMMKSTSKVNDDPVPNTENPKTFDNVEKNMSLTNMSTKKKGKSKKKSKQRKSEVNTGGETSKEEIVDSNLAVTPKQTLKCTASVQEPGCLAPENEDGMVPVLVIKYKGDNDNLPKRTKKWIHCIINQDLDGELEKTVTKRLGAKETVEKLSDRNPDDNYIVIPLRKPDLKFKNENTKQNCVGPENEVIVRKAGSKNKKNTVKQVLLKQTQIDTSNLLSQDLGQKQILNTVLEGQQPQTLNNPEDLKLLRKVIAEPENENVIIKEVMVTNTETLNEKTVKPMLLKQLQIDTFDRVGQNTTAHPEKAIETFGKNSVFRIEIKEKQVLAGIEKECQTIFIKASMTRDNLKRSLLKQLKTSPLHLAGQDSKGDVEETIGCLTDKQFSNRILNRQETFENYFNLNDVQGTLIFEIYMNYNTKKTIAIPWKYIKDKRFKAHKGIICLKDFQGSFQDPRGLKYAVSCDVIMKLSSHQYRSIYKLIYEWMINCETWPENKNLLVNSPFVEPRALWRPSLQTSNLKLTFHEEKNIPSLSSDCNKEVYVYDNNFKLFGNGDYKCTTCFVQITDETDSTSCLGTSVCDKISGLKDQKIGNSGTARILPDLDDNVNNTHDGNVLRDKREWGYSTEFVADKDSGDDSREEKKQMDDFSNDEAEIETDSLGSRLCHVAFVVTLAYLVVSLIAQIALFLLYNIFFLSVILVLYFYMKR